MLLSEEKLFSFQIIISSSQKCFAMENIQIYIAIPGPGWLQAMAQIHPTGKDKSWILAIQRNDLTLTHFVHGQSSSYDRN